MTKEAKLVPGHLQNDQVPLVFFAVITQLHYWDFPTVAEDVAPILVLHLQLSVYHCDLIVLPLLLLLGKKHKPRQEHEVTQKEKSLSLAPLARVHVS